MAQQSKSNAQESSGDFRGDIFCSIFVFICTVLCKRDCCTVERFALNFRIFFVFSSADIIVTYLFLTGPSKIINQKLVALYDYQSRNANDLSFNKNEEFITLSDE